jgi:hypothetical protein
MRSKTTMTATVVPMCQFCGARAERAAIRRRLPNLEGGRGLAKVLLGEDAVDAVGLAADGTCAVPHVTHSGSTTRSPNTSVNVTARNILTTKRHDEAAAFWRAHTGAPRTHSMRWQRVAAVSVSPTRRMVTAAGYALPMMMCSRAGAAARRAGSSWAARVQWARDATRAPAAAPNLVLEEQAVREERV